jgi:hypothetical protein
LDPLRTIYETGYDQPILVLVDSLDEALASSAEVKIVDLLATVQRMDKRVRFILTSRPEPRIENRLASASRLSLSDPVHKDDNDYDIAKFVTLRIEKDPALRAKTAALPPAQGASLPADISTRADGNFQYVAFLLRAAATGQQSLASLDDLPPGLDSLYHESLRRVVTLGKKDRDTVYKPFLGVLSVTLEPLPLELLQTYTASPTSLWNVYLDLSQFVEAVPISPLAGEKASTEDCYRIYHQSVIDFLHKQQWVEVGSGEKKTNEYYVEARDANIQIVVSCEKPKGSWEQVNWRVAPYYTLRRLVAHLYQLRHIDGYTDKLHALLQTRAFIDAHLAILGKPYLLLDDLRLALNLALENDSLDQAWRHLREYRRVIRNQLDFDQLRQAVETSNKTGDYVHAMERTGLYGYMPNSQALARLWIAWNATASGYPSEAESIVNRALDRLPPRGTAHFNSRRAGDSTTRAVEDAVGETLQRLLVRIAGSAPTAPRAPSDWLQEAMSSWPALTVDAVVGRLSEPLASWGELVDAGNTSETMESLFKELRERGGRLDAEIASERETIYLFQRRLAGGLFNSRHDPSWLQHVQRSIDLIALDDYPSYREMALSWVAAAALAQEDPALARKTLAAVLGGMFKPSPGFWGDTVASAMDGMGLEDNQQPNPSYLLSLLEHVEATGERGVDLSVYRKMPDIIEWRRKVGLPDDPWSFGTRRRSAVAAVLYRRGDLPGAEALLQEASAAPHEGSYAGFRALARLSLACRWLEWRRPPEAVAQTFLAETDASHVRDDVLRQERVDLVRKTRTWITDYGQNPALLNEDEALAQIQHKSGLERGMFIELLSALWSDNAARLKRLLALALDDATTADAVLGRLLGVEALQTQPGRPFLQLVKALQVDTGVENE